MVTTFNTNKLFKVRTPSQTAPMEQFPETGGNQISYRRLGDMWIPVYLCVLCHGARNVFTSTPITHLWALSHFFLLFPLLLASISSMAKPGRKKYYELVNEALSQ